MSTFIARTTGTLRTDDFHETPREATEALLSVETFDGAVWEPACGNGAISRVLAERGHTIVSTDLIDRGYGLGGIDFLMEWKPLAPNIITNPPFKLAEEFASRAVSLCTGKVAIFERLAWLEGKARGKFFREHPPSRVWVFSGRLPMMHRFGYDGPKSSSTVAYAWFVWDTDATGDTALGWLP